MRRLLQFVLCVGLATVPLPMRAGEVIDRIVATVNRNVILQSDVEMAVRYQLLIETRTLASVNSKDMQTALDRLIDQQLLLQEMGTPDSFTVPERELKTRLEELRAQYPEASTDEGWRALLRRYGLDEAEIAERLKMQTEILRFVDLRLRPNARVDDSAVEEYYRNEFLPKLRQAGGKEVPLTEVAARIRRVLTERHIDELLGEWLHNLREQGDIHTEMADHVPADPQHASASPAPPGTDLP